ncbi:MAG: hypothetical protein QOI55_2974, partial [Actinomycetota bacterium]|nr:hypothetical protein [Actinomycetota bacterium]
MSTTSRKQRNRAQDIRRAQARRYPVLPVIVGGVVVLLIVLIVAVVLSKDDKKNSGSGSANGVAQVHAVRVDGSPLPTFDSSASGDPAIGDPAPTLIGQNFAGKPVTIRNDGRPKAIVFVAHWCPHCQAEIPRIANYLKNTGLPKNVELYIVPTSTSPN